MHTPQSHLAPQSHHDRQFATFYLGDTLFGIEIRHIQEINRTQHPTPVPHAPEAVCGVINLRGSVVSVLDLRKILAISSNLPFEQTRTMVLLFDGERIGLVVDRVADVLTLPSAELLPPPANARGSEGRYFEGVYRLEHELLVILKVDEVITSLLETAE